MQTDTPSQEIDETFTLLRRMLSQYEGASPKAIAAGSAAQMLHFIEDAKHDIVLLASTLNRANRNREMWKGQCERQADEITRLLKELEAARKALAPILALQAECVGALTCQRQIDFDGCEVGVSRQAVDEIYAALTKARAALGEGP